MGSPLCISTNQVIDREDSWSPREQEYQDRAPDQMLVVRVGVHERLDHGNHSQEWKRRDAGRQAEKKENRDCQLLHHGDACRDRRVQ